MILRKIDKKRLCEIISDKLKAVPAGTRIKIDKEILDQLLFDRFLVVMRKDLKTDLAGQQVSIKMISNELPDPLSKIDLSEVSFDNVCWNGDDIQNCIEKVIGSDKEDIKRMRTIPLVNTNAKIDLSKSQPIEEKGKKIYKIKSTDFRGTNLENNCLSGNYYFYNCNFRNTGIIFDLTKDSNISFISCNLEGVDLSNQTVDEKAFVIGGSKNARIYSCNLKYTGLKIESDNFQNQPDELKDMYNMIFGGKLVGCYINGRKILTHSKAERKTISMEQKMEYDNYRGRVIDKVTNDLDEQIQKVKRNN